MQSTALRPVFISNLLPVAGVTTAAKWRFYRYFRNDGRVKPRRCCTARL